MISSYKGTQSNIFSSNVPIALSEIESSSSFIISTGRVNIFLTLIEQESFGVRIHVAELGTGDLFTACPRLYFENQEYAYIAVPTETTICVVDSLKHLSTEYAERTALLEKIDIWLGTLFYGIGLDMGLAPQRTESDLGDIVVPEGSAYAPERRLVWYCLQSGTYSLCGLATAVQDAALPPSAWITATDAGTITTQTSEQAFAHAFPEERWNKALRQLALLTVKNYGRILLHKRTLEMQEKARDAEETQAQLHRLSSVLRPVKERSQSSGDPLEIAVHIISEACQLTYDFLPKEEADPELRLIEFCAMNQWRMRRISLKSSDIFALHAAPMIGFYGEEALPCVIKPNGVDGVWYPPRESREEALTAEKAALFKPFAYIFYETLPNRKSSYRDMFTFILRGSFRVLVISAIVGVLSGLFGLILPIATSYVTGKIIPTSNKPELWQLLTLLISLTVGNTILNLVPQLTILMFSTRLQERLLAAVFDRLLKIPVDFFRKFSAGDLCMRVLAVMKMQQSLFEVLSQQFIGSLFAICSVALLFVYSWQLALVAIPLALLYASLLFCLFIKIRKPLEIGTAAAGRQAGNLKQFFDGITKIRGAGAEERIVNRFLVDFAEEQKAKYTQFIGTGRIAIAGVLFPAVTYCLFFYLVGDIWRGTLELSSFLAFLSAFGIFQAGAIGIGDGVWKLITMKPELERLRPILEENVEVADGKPQAGKLDGSLELSSVTFRYSPDRPPVLHDLSLRAASGEFIAIVGPSGAGKSSFVRLLLGFETPESGSVLYGGRDLCEMDVNSVRRQLGVILQNSKVLPGSIFDNITMGTNYTLADAEEAAKAAALDKDIAKMPMGMFTIVADGIISGGQQQRILIARSLLGKPSIIIMDESTSALDNETQEIVRLNIEKLKATRIVIAHRLSTVINADRIYVLERGTVVQCGTFVELVAQEGLFKQLAQRQLL